ncbi:RNA-binding KH domain-containing protein RCF3-like [Salvia splendens]|uniref:RNA-binding KH domain-containing protein RCF3-like n=1 Tax=Salvia splendens TaxID=180675 RepID=UPI001C257CA6|nr:RNA-binding KH domain-containing protein RCF3-like [Salvia splendens]
MSAQVTPAKRPLDQSLTDVRSERKSQKSEALGSDIAPFNASSRQVIRVLCPASRIRFINGKDGSIVSQIGQATGAKVCVEEKVLECNERVITIVAPDKAKEMVSGQVKDEDRETKIPDSSENPEEDGEGNKEHGVRVDHSKSDKDKENSAVQKALLAVFNRMVGMFAGSKKGEEEGKKKFSHVRLLVFHGQVGRLLGRSGCVMKQMTSESGAVIQILPKNKLPSCASSTDDLVQISGTHDAIRKALLSVSQELLERIPKYRDPFLWCSSSSQSHSFGAPRQDRCPPPHNPFHGHGAPYPSGFLEGGAGMNFPPVVMTYRVLCNEEKVGGVIGKGGTIIKALQHESGCDIKVVASTGETEDRIITISGPAHPDDAVSPAQDGVLRVQARIFRSAPVSKDKSLVAKLLVSSHQIGCLLGKSGSVISEMRKSSGAYICILSKNQVPKNASENEEVVQVSGDLEAVQEALVQITSRLKKHFFQAPYMGRREFSPSPTFSNRGPPFNNFDASVGLPPVGGFHPREHDDQQPVSTSTTVEVVVPSFAVPAIYGDEGGCLRQIREISDAEVTITNPKDGASETVIILSGTPEQTIAAQSLLQAFVICEMEALNR